MKMLSVKEAAGVLGVSPDTVRRWIRKEYLKAWKFPGRGRHEFWRISSDDLPPFMKKNGNAA